MGELVRADSLDADCTLVIEYDNLGNITKMKKTACTFGDLTNCQFTEYNYTYGNTSWTDLLTNYNGSNIYYDEIGNPTTYYTGADLTWIGRRLRAYSLDNITNTYTYNDDGIRVKKVSADSNTNTTVTTEYVLDGSNIIAIVEDGAVKTRFYYDADGTRIAMDYLGSTYYYQYNLQGDVIALLDGTFTPVVTYTYGPWGTVENITDSTNISLSTINPFLYRGYFYDADTELYYLQSRYYDPATGRWISAEPNVDFGEFDEGAGLLAYNSYAYCANNPIIYNDENGESVLLAMAIGFCVGALVSGGIKIYKNYKSGQKWYKGLALSMLAGGVGGAISCISIPGVSTWVCAAIFGAAGNVATKVILGEIKTIGDLTSAIAVGATAGLLGNAASKVLIKGVTKYFGSLTRSSQKAFLSRVGQITNRQLTAIRQEIKKGLTPAILNKLVKKYGYDVVVSAFVSSTASSAKK